MKYIASAEYVDYPDLCFFRGNTFEYVTLFRQDETFFLVGKRRYGCCQTIEMTLAEAESWIRALDHVKAEAIVHQDNPPKPSDRP